MVVGWIEWTDKAARDAAWPKIMADPRMSRDPMPFDDKRKMRGGVEALRDARPDGLALTDGRRRPAARISRCDRAGRFVLDPSLPDLYAAAERRLARARAFLRTLPRGRGRNGLARGGRRSAPCAPGRSRERSSGQACRRPGGSGRQSAG